MEKVRVRFAPSPTGALHLGGVRTALYDYLFAKHHGGDFVLRIEDTDSARYVEGAEEYIMEALEWCGIVPDESPKHGGPYAPYRQSERRAIYDQYTDQILKTDYAYIAFDTPEELDAIRKEFESRGEVFAYNYRTRGRLRNSISLPKEEVEQLLAENTPYVVRFKMPVDRIVSLKDIIRGDFSVNTNDLDDKVLVKNDGMPTYHFANIIDDHEMKITHVIRGEEWLPSMALHILLYEAMGWDAPEFAHLSLILKPEGKGKLSKRDGAKFGFPVFPLDFQDPESGEVWKGYRESGYFPEAFINMVALLGWTPADDKEILSMEEMVQEFDLYKVHKAGARFSLDKAKWFNHQYLQQKSNDQLLEELKQIEGVNSKQISDEVLLKIVSLMKERATFVKDIYEEGKFFFEAPQSFDEKAVKKAWKEDTHEVMSVLLTVLEAISFDTETIKNAIHDFATEKSLGMGKVMMPLRLALVGELKGPDVPDLMTIIGKEESLNRLKKALEVLK
ncbi:glutamate--tRNA ligase [Riemerella anatipestifer]|uniref:Glutamate--tRNA ligase n=1 Tax=Riemerella anatipestifer (strain ATCC 11845 / DSM 15868 / JCM 9532 / NCTC 11014) TaxID=693978 RepID=E4TBW0_RIEAD|nr:glutamate--tRNA ligase [Riemerella anatipestifer]ADQ82007.1 glutamyl-tRNA synthetase [Riemerella anatipestifer ATCC 11845 = DSM 15868]ADZ12494.1 Glutamyl- and glutaminyl-tRNA synthetase [Riemerella anatipestifer RA-GD]AFD56009.1 glutamyl-tRNA synthetase [Riemerella anatipestifer ATCC 11845 = DSM 15868]AKP69234.1 glutamyl-tRNA synthetase [Riemerella anatipestifer]AKQ40267.1 glutamyl-tRNA synthetase [Riemerella anatipestifer Yb2]